MWKHTSQPTKDSLCLEKRLLADKENLLISINIAWSVMQHKKNKHTCFVSLLYCLLVNMKNKQINKHVKHQLKANAYQLYIKKGGNKYTLYRRCMSHYLIIHTQA